MSTQATQTNGAATNGAGNPAPQQPAAIEKRAPLGFDLANMDDAWRFAGMLSRSGLLPEAIRGHQEDILITILTGRDFGLSPMQSCRLICVVDGRPYMYAALKLSLVKRSKECLKFRCVETTSEKATFETDREGEGVTTMTFTMDDARRAGLPDRGKDPSRNNWHRYPGAMLRWRCISQLCDFVYPDVLGAVGDRADLDSEVVDGGQTFLERVTQEVTAPPQPTPPPGFTAVEVLPPTPAPAATQTEPSPSPAAPAAAQEVSTEKPRAEIQDVPADPLELEIAAIKSGLRAAKTKKEALAFSARIMVLPPDLKQAAARLYEEVVRGLPAK